MENKFENFWETEYPFAKFLKSIFPNYKRKYSLDGNGIFNLVTINNKLYEIKYTKTMQMGINDNHTLDTDKKFIIETIINNLKTNKEVAVFGGKYITFYVGNFIAKVEIIKKLKIPT